MRNLRPPRHLLVTHVNVHGRDGRGTRPSPARLAHGAGGRAGGSLSLTRRIVVSHNGQISVRSQTGVGSTFRIRFAVE